MQTVVQAPPQSPKRLTLWLALASVYILWGSTYLFIHFMTEHMPPLYMASMRFLVAGGLLYGYARLTGAPRPTWTHVRSAGLVGLLLLGLANGSVTVAVHYIPTGVAAMIAALVPVFLLSLNWVTFAKTRPSNLALAGLLLGLLGVYLLIKPDKFQSANTASNNLIGGLLVLLADVAWAVGTLLSPRLPLPSPFLSSGIQMLVAALALFLVSMATEPVTPLSILNAPPEALGAMAYLVVFGSIIGFSSYAWLARNAPPALVSTYAYVNPVIAMLLGTLFAGEVFRSQSLIGAGIVVAGVVLITLGRK
ncbi:MAG: EamA family transporter [Cytophagales bacterium]|nr:MAG: EamA family transporter [Cytophagales bacterium]